LRDLARGSCQGLKAVVKKKEVNAQLRITETNLFNKRIREEWLQ